MNPSKEFNEKSFYIKMNIGCAVFGGLILYGAMNMHKYIPEDNSTQTVNEENFNCYDINLEWQPIPAILVAMLSVIFIT